jgi:hypothetical protein
MDIDKECMKHPYLSLGEGEVCTLENMGPLWIHINLTQWVEERVAKAQYSGSTSRRRHDNDPHEYRLVDIMTNTPVIDWGGPYDLIDYLVEELGITSALERLGMYLKHGKVLKRRYRVEVRKKNS